MTTAFEGKVAVVTGAGSGIGLATAQALLANGAQVVLFDCNEDALSLARQTFPESGERVVGVLGDVSRSADVNGLMQTTLTRFHRLDLLINSAALQPYGTVETTSESQWDRVLSVNLKGPYLTSHYAVPLMRNNGGGVIVNVASVQGSACQANVAAYAASKGALLALTRAMALDHARDGIRVNSVSPGSIDTPALRAGAQSANTSMALEKVLEQWGLAHPLGRIGQADEVAALILFLCSAEATFCTGGDYRVDGGLLAKLAVVEEING
jgi:NAD(P)-dependent dehydrogenase (short-subunit alcohol dehydrogenase family)